MAARTSVQFRLLVVAALLLLSSCLTVSLVALHAFEGAFTPALAQKAEAVGDSLGSLVTKITGYGVPLDELRGMENVFAAVLRDNPDIGYLAIRDAREEMMFERFRIREEGGRIDEADLDVRAVPIMSGGRKVGSVLIGADRTFIQRQMNEIITDILTVLVVSGLVAIEMLMFLTMFMVTSPLFSIRAVVKNARDGDMTQLVSLQGGDEVTRYGASINRAIVWLTEAYHKHKPVVLQDFRFANPKQWRGMFTERLMYIRPPLFLLIFSESMSLSFFPIYVDSVYEPIAGLSKEVVIGLPISIFMLIWALSLPFAGQWSDRTGRRRSFLIGAGLTAVGLVLTGLAENLMQLLVVRSFTAIGYGIVFISAQGYVTDHTSPENRTKGMALFLSGFFSGSLCGAAIGGILADRIGYQATFFLSAGLSVASALFVSRFLVEGERGDKPAPPKLSWRDFGQLLGNRYFLVITFMAAIPAKMALTGFLYYAGPLYLISLGASQSATGRVLMGYGLAIIIISPLAAMVADKLKKRQSFVVIGGLLSGLSLLTVYLFDNIWGMLGGVVMLGTAHAIGVSPQLSMVTEIQNRPGAPQMAIGKTIGIFRLTERAGNIAGPLIAGTLIAAFGFSGTFLGLGLFTLGSILTFTLLMIVFTQVDRRRMAAEAAA